MEQQSEHDAWVETVWRTFLETGEDAADDVRINREWLKPIMRLAYFSLKVLPAQHRCIWCNAPLRGLTAPFMRAVGKAPSTLNPRFCDDCENFARKHHGGAEVELSLLFADIRGSTGLAEGRSPSEFSDLIDRFYTSTTDVLVRANALIDKLAGDEVAAIFVRGLAGQAFPRRAVEAAQGLLRATGHAEPDGPWIPVGAGVHTGVAFVGAVGTPNGMSDITVLGDAANTAARLASEAAPGEIIVSEDTMQAARLSMDGLEQRHLTLKGRTEPVNVRVMRAQ